MGSNAKGLIGMNFYLVLLHLAGAVILLLWAVRMVRTWLLNDLFVAPSARRQGVAAALLGAAAEHARALGAAGLSLSTARDNAPAQALYESLGWQRDRQF